MWIPFLADFRGHRWPMSLWRYGLAPALGGPVSPPYGFPLCDDHGGGGVGSDPSRVKIGTSKMKACAAGLDDRINFRHLFCMRYFPHMLVALLLLALPVRAETIVGVVRVVGLWQRAGLPRIGNTVVLMMPMRMLQKRRCAACGPVSSNCRGSGAGRREGSLAFSAGHSYQWQ